MKEAVGGVSLFNIVIVFVLLFTGYISLSINYSKAYNVKNELITIIKNQGGVCTSNRASVNDNCYNFAQQIQDFFKETSYRSVANCNTNDGWLGYSRSGELLTDGKNASFCVKAIKVKSNSELPNALYYQVKVFYQLDLPVIHNLFEFSIFGETSRIYEPNECGCSLGAERDRYTWCAPNPKCR